MTTYNVNVYLFYDGGYHLIPRDDVAAAGVTFSRGVTSELDLEKGDLSFRLLDPTDQYRPSNPASALYGILGPYLPMAYQVGSAARFAGQLESLVPAETDGHRESGGVTVRGSRWVDVKASDPIGAINKWREPVSSPMRLHISGMATLAAYWPGEDGEDADRMSAAYGASAAQASGVEFANADGPPGSNRLLTLGAAGRLSGLFPATISTSGWQLAWCTDMAGADATERLVVSWRTTQGWTWRWFASTSTYRITVTDGGGVSLLDSGVSNGGVGPGDDVVTRMKVTRSGSTWTVEQAWWRAGDTVLIGTTSTFSGGTGRPTQWDVVANTIMNGAYFGHMFAVTTGTEDLQSDAALQAINGYPDERTSDRFERMCGLRNIPAQILGDEATATRMGYQRTGPIKSQLQEVQRTEMGLIFPSRDGRGLKLALRSYLYEQAATPALELTYPDDTGPIKEINTAVDLYNVVVAENRSGVSATAVEATGRYGTADPPDGAGVIDKTVAVNLADQGDTDQAASSYLRFFQQVQRFGEITVDLDGVPGLRSAVEAVDVGQFIRLTGRTPDPVLLLVIGIAGADRRTRYTTTFTVIPGAVFDVSLWDGDRRWGLSSCTLAADYDETDTALTLDIGDNEQWSSTPGYGLMIAGERVTVTAMGARTGSAGSYQQVATVTRSVNGVVKTQTSGTQVLVADSGTWGW